MTREAAYSITLVRSHHLPTHPRPTTTYHPSARAGLGALLVRRDALEVLHRGKRYFGGGTVSVALPGAPFFTQRRPGGAGLEDGTLPFLDIPALAHGFAFVRRLGGFPAVAAHAGAVAAALAARLAALRHGNGRRVCMLYGAHRAGGAGEGESDDARAGRGVVVGQGPVVAFNVQRADGSFVGYREVERLASLHAILLRTGCLCNPGACAQALGLTAAGARCAVLLCRPAALACTSCSVRFLAWQTYEYESPDLHLSLLSPLLLPSQRCWPTLRRGTCAGMGGT